MSSPTPTGPGHPDFQSSPGWSQQLGVINTSVPSGAQTSIYTEPMGNFASLRVNLTTTGDGVSVVIYSSQTRTARSNQVWATPLLSGQTLDVTIPAIGPYVDVTAGAATPGSPATLTGFIQGTNQPVEGAVFNGGPLLVQIEATSVPASTVSGILVTPPFAGLCTLYYNPIDGPTKSNMNITCLNADHSVADRIYARNSGFGIDVTTFIAPISPLVVQVSNQDTVAHTFDCSMTMRGY